MPLRAGRDMTLPVLVSPLAVAGVFIGLCARLEEPDRRSVSSLMISGAGAAYLGGGLGVWEVGFCALLAYLGFRGLRDYRFISAGWVLHTLWDVVHHLFGNPILPFVPTSSAGCAICDLVLAAWYFGLRERD